MSVRKLVDTLVEAYCINCSLSNHWSTRYCTFSNIHTPFPHSSSDTPENKSAKYNAVEQFKLTTQQVRFEMEERLYENLCGFITYSDYVKTNGTDAGYSDFLSSLPILTKKNDPMKAGTRVYCKAKGFGEVVMCDRDNTRTPFYVRFFGNNGTFSYCHYQFDMTPAFNPNAGDAYKLSIKPV